ncbi:MAG: hypothetical protein BSOLF_2717 [Candidatus Carbobacillus altaicus]|uniref:Uncharacterized protein n=1 Tax=Candidatus Carbonibacillus altaicus TaxID=2163959 RepID=A0A2R6Y238_9BACL|nr:MAG: hypothetical protein BSOLF_2717 [Candidatus Carbobacillus altaicus]
MIQNPRLKLTLLYILLLVLDWTGLLSSTGFFHVRLTALYVVIAALFLRPAPALVLGFGTGLLLDIVFGRFVGLETFFWTFYVSFLSEVARFFYRSIFLIVPLAGFSLALFDLYVDGLYRLFRWTDASFVFIIQHAVVPDALGGMISALILYPLMVPALRTLMQERDVSHEEV